MRFKRTFNFNFLCQKSSEVNNEGAKKIFNLTICVRFMIPKLMNPEFNNGLLS